MQHNDSKAKPPDGRRLCDDALIHIFKDHQPICNRYYIEVNLSISTVTEDHANCPVCVIASRKIIEDLINPPEKVQPTQSQIQLQQQTLLNTLRSIEMQNILNQPVNQNISMGNAVTSNQGHMNNPVNINSSNLPARSPQVQAQYDAQEKLFSALDLFNPKWWLGNKK